MNAKTKLGSILFAALVVSAGACKKDEGDKAKEGKDPAGKVAADKDPGKAPGEGKAPAKTMTGEELAAWYQQCWSYYSDKKWDEFKGCYAPDAVSENIDSGMPPMKGPEAIVAANKMFAEAMPDLKASPALVLVNGPNVVGVWHIAGTHTAPLKGGPQEIPATNKKIGLMMVHGVETNPSGKAVKEWSLFDGTSFMGQLGLLPEGVPFRAAGEAPAEAQVVVAKNDETEKKNLEAYKAGVEAFNKHDLEAYKAMVADDVVWSDLAMPKDQNKEEMLAGLKEFWGGFSDVKLEPASTWAAGDYVVSTGTASGTNDGEMEGLGKTGKKVTMTYVEVDKFEDGKLAAGWLFMNGAAMAQQLGLMDAKAEDGKGDKGDKKKSK